MAADAVRHITGISSMATRSLLADLAADSAARCGVAVRFESQGGVAAAWRVAAGEAFDVVVLTADVLATLAADGHLRAPSILPVAISPAALAIRSGAPRPVIARDVDLYAALRQAGRIGYSTGPSGTALLARLDRAGLLAELKPRLVLAPVGVPVATLLREGAADVAIQQLSELADRDGVEVVGPLPPGVAIDTTFSAAVAEQAADPGAAYDFIAYLTSPQVHGAIRRAHMAPAGITPGETA